MVKGSQPLPKLDRNEIRPQTKVHEKSMQTQFKVMKWAVAKCPNVKLKIMGVSLMWQDHFNRYFRLQLGPTEGSVADTHHMFNLASASGEAIPLSRYVKLHVEFLGLQVPMVGFLITQNPKKY